MNTNRNYDESTVGLGTLTLASRNYKIEWSYQTLALYIHLRPRLPNGTYLLHYDDRCCAETVSNGCSMWLCQLGPHNVTET